MAGAEERGTRSSSDRDGRISRTGGGGGGCTPLYKPYRYVQPHRVGFLRRFGLKTDLIHFAHFGLESGMVFEGTQRECMNVFAVSILNR